MCVLAHVDVRRTAVTARSYFVADVAALSSLPSALPPRIHLIYPDSLRFPPFPLLKTLRIYRAPSGQLGVKAGPAAAAAAMLHNTRKWKEEEEEKIPVCCRERESEGFAGLPRIRVYRSMSAPIAIVIHRTRQAGITRTECTQHIP